MLECDKHLDFASAAADVGADVVVAVVDVVVVVVVLAHCPKNGCVESIETYPTQSSR